jgi:hypothetical protein
MWMPLREPILAAVVRIPVIRIVRQPLSREWGN